METRWFVTLLEYRMTHIQPRLDGKAEKRNIRSMKTTVDLPDPLFRKAKASAAERGISLKHFITEAVENRLTTPPADSNALTKPWMRILSELPRVPQVVLEEVRQRLAEADAADMKLQGGAHP